MSSILRIATVLATLTFSASAADISGSWKLRVTGGVIHKTFGEVTLDLKAGGGTLTGTAHVGDNIYPGKGPVLDGRIDGDHVSFRVVGQTASSDGIPVMTFHGTIHGDHIELTMHMVSPRVDGGETELAGEKVN